MRRSLFAIALVAAAVPAAAAQDTKSADDWKFQVAPYIWGASMKGDLTIAGRQVPVDLSASDIFNHMDIGWMGMFAARKGNWGVVGDFLWVDLGADTRVGHVDQTLGIASVIGTRRVSDWAEMTFGARYTRVDATVDFTVPGPASIDKKQDWIDPIVGVIIRTPGEHKWHGKLVADVGGFGVGSAFTWQAIPTASVDLAKWCTLEFGWRWLSTDYETGSGLDEFKYEILLQGPIVGAAFKW